MARHLCRLLLVVIIGAAWSSPFAAAAQTRSAGEHWVTTWATAVVPRASQPTTAAPVQGGPQTTRFNNQTLRQIVHVSLGGDRIRIVLSNAFGTAPLEIGAAHVGLRQKNSDVATGTGRAVTFGGHAAATIAPGSVLVSDPIPFAVPPLADLSIDIHLPGDSAASSSPLTVHANALQTSYASAAGNHSGASTFPVASTSTSWFFLARVEVLAPAGAGAVAILGDSLTDGSRSTPDTNNRWPDHLARAFARRGIPMAVVNAGIGGNRVVADNNSPSALARLDRDVLVPSGVTHVVVMGGINDIGRGVEAAELIAAHRQIIERARAQGLIVIGATLTPIEDTTFEGYYTAPHEAARQALNTWIRTANAYDAVIDFDAALRDASRPSRLQAQYASPDYIHPNDAGYRAMADAVDITLFARPAVSNSR